MSEATICHINQEIGAPVKNFHLMAISGQKTSLPRILWRKKGAVIVFWSGICSHCARYDGYLNRFEKQHPELRIAAVASRDGETLEQLRATARERNLTFPILHDPGGRVANQWFARQTPRVFLIDADHLLLYRGAIDNYKYPGDPEYAAYLDPAIVEFLAGKPISRTESASFGCAVQSIYYNLPRSL